MAANARGLYRLTVRMNTLGVNLVRCQDPKGQERIKARIFELKAQYDQLDREVYEQQVGKQLQAA